VHTSNQTKENKYPIDEIRVGGIGYIALPTHPNFGRPVRVIQQIHEGEQRWYLIEDLSHPGFHMQILAHWLSPTPVKETESQLEQATIVLSLSALDKLVQMILRKDQRWRAEKNESASGQRECADVAAAASRKQDTTESLSLLHGPRPGRRHTK
jgi:hypothetical protein